MAGQFTDECLADEQMTEVRVDPFDDGPRRAGTIGPRDDLFCGRNEIIVALVIVPVLGRDAVASQRIAAQRIEPLLLRFAAQVHPEFENQHTIIGKRAFEPDDFSESIVEYLVSQAVVHVMNQRL